MPTVYCEVMTPKKLRAWRTRRQLTQSGLGSQLGVNKMTVYRWEAGMRQIPPFLHLALRCLEREGGGGKRRGEKSRQKGGE